MHAWNTKTGKWEQTAPFAIDIGVTTGHTLLAAAKAAHYSHTLNRISPHSGEQDLAAIAADTLVLPGDYYAVENGECEGLAVLFLLVTATHVISLRYRKIHCGCTNEQGVERAETTDYHR